MLKIALLGNPNTGKTSLFNLLTGLNQKVGNYPGVTTEKKAGIASLGNGQRSEITDLPGLYSLTPASADEALVTRFLFDSTHRGYPDVALIVADATNLKRNLFLYTQVKDLGIPTLLAINMIDEAERKGISIDEKVLEREFQTPVVKISVRKHQAIHRLKKRLSEPIAAARDTTFDLRKLPGLQEDTTTAPPSYRALLSDFSTAPSRPKPHSSADPGRSERRADSRQLRLKESIYRYQAIHQILKQAVRVDKTQARDFSSKLDRALTHKFWGYIIFVSILALIFQALFSWTEAPMDWIDQRFAALAAWVQVVLPPGVFTDLLSTGVIPGIGGILLFVPQIAVLFCFLSLLEESGYLSRVVFLMDKFMRRFGMSGKSVVPLISGVACAIPAILSTRNIENWRERLITIMVTPFMTCSARIPVYTLLISIVIPDVKWGVFNLRGLVLMALYLLGVIVALLAALIFRKLLKQTYKSFLIVELPPYRVPQLRNIGLSVLSKTQAFAWGAGKIILAVSVVLWFLARYGYPRETLDRDATAAYEQTYSQREGPSLLAFVRSYKLEHSYLGQLGQLIEPALQPLGYNWKIGIALLSSLAAREVFVGTLASIYSVQDGHNRTIQQQLSEERKADGAPLFDLATGVSLLLFYAFAMQCMSTVAVVKRETQSWKWPAVQFAFMTLLAYTASLLAYQFLK